MASRILVVYYSRSGHTQQLARQIAEATGADLEMIDDATNRKGLRGYARSLYEAVRERQPAIARPTFDPHAYRIVIIGTPIWAASPASPVRRYLQEQRDRFRAVAFFCTCGGRGGEHAFSQMARDCGQEPVSTLIVRQAELARTAAAVERFVADVETGTPASAAAFAPRDPVPPMHGR